MQQKRSSPRSAPPPTAKLAWLELRPDRAFAAHRIVACMERNRER
jgi:hypothetical protein